MSGPRSGIKCFNGTAFATTLIAVVVFSGNAVEAIAKPSVSFTLQGSGTAGTATPFSYTARGRIHGDRLVVQRQVGTAQVWRTVRELTGRSGSSALPALPLGNYRVRIVDINKQNLLLAQVQQTLHVFGIVPFSTLFSSVPFNCCSFAPGTYSTPTKTFDYFFHSEYDGDLQGTQDELIFTVMHNACRSIHFDFVPGKPDFPNPPGPMTITLTLVQASADPVSASATTDSFGALDGQLTPGQSWGLRDSANPVKAAPLYINGSASCDSTTHFS
jgi:hypothetical protein